ncbi:cell envelope integrity protein TolA [Limnohabitans sp.]|jgi:colicin import membrane protein|uniref:cell envelope integrity protein TolA n=1 Tax=Limnohabitans sp. TaxID=1907725 RepID=UPI00286F2F67|nr:cell envelope integrity protein TolA [Limnohabitans sp.]
MSVQAQHLEFAPPPAEGTGRSLAAALFVHGLLLVALTAGIQWQQDDSLSVEAELWSAVPMAAAPPLAAVEPPPPPPPEPKPQPKPEPIQKPVVVKPPPPEPNREAEIALAKRRKQLDDEKKLQEAKEAEKRKQLEHKKEEDKKAELKKAQEKKDKLKAEEEKRKLDAKRDDERKEKERKEAKQLQAQKDAKQAAEDAKKLDAIRSENMRRIAGMAGATGSENATGTALRASGPSDSYGGRIRARIKPNITFTEDIASNTPAEVEVRCAPDGTIVARKLVKSSGNTAWDNAVLKAIDKTEVLPRDTDGRVHSPLIISFRPRD